MKVAKLIRFNFIVRVIVDDTDREVQILDKAHVPLCQVIEGGLGDHVFEIVPDIECPYDPDTDDEKFKTIMVTPEEYEILNDFLPDLEGDDENRKLCNIIEEIGENLIYFLEKDRSNKIKRSAKNTDE
jgi:hypothetical protein